MWGRTGECLCALVVLLVVGVVQGRHHPTLGNEVDDVDQRAKDLMDSFSQVHFFSGFYFSNYSTLFSGSYLSLSHSQPHMTG